MEKFTGKSPKMRELLEGGAKGGGLGSLKGFTGGKKTLFKSKDFPKIMSKMKVQFPKGMPRIKRSDMRIRNEQLKSKLKSRQKAIETQKKVPGYVQTKASKKVTDKFITRETKVSFTAPFKTVGEQRKVINQIKSNVQVRQLNRTLKGTKKDTNYKTPPASLQKSSGRTLKKTKKVLKEPDSKEFAQDVKSYVKLKNQKKK